MDAKTDPTPVPAPAPAEPSLKQRAAQLQFEIGHRTYLIVRLQGEIQDRMDALRALGPMEATL